MEELIILAIGLAITAADSFISLGEIMSWPHALWTFISRRNFSTKMLEFFNPSQVERESQMPSQTDVDDALQTDKQLR